MKSEPPKSRMKKSAWVIDESKCLENCEVKKLIQASRKLRIEGLSQNRFALLRAWFMIQLGLQTGLRVSEMASLKHHNLLMENGRSSIVLIGKGNKKRAIWINSQFKKVCESYLTIKNKFGYCNDAESYLLNNVKGLQISRRALQKTFKTVLKLANLPNHYSIHCLRHTYATFLLRASNHNYRFLQQQLGHASIKTTQVYASVIESDGRQAIEQIYKS